MRRAIPFLIPAVLVGAAAATGCAAEPKDGVTATEVNAEQLAKKLQEFKGKVVLVDCWALWCRECVKDFPHLVGRHKKYADKGLVCVSLSLDKVDPEDYKKDKVLTFLRDKGATFPNLILAEPAKEETAVIKLIGDYTGPPYMVLFGRDGRKVWASDQSLLAWFPFMKLSGEQFDRLIEQELDRKP